MGEIGQALDLVAKYGLELVVLAVVTVLAVYLFKLNQQGWKDRLADQQTSCDKRFADVEARRVEERQSRLDAEARLDSNAAVFREAVSAAAASQKLMETLVERSDQRPPRRS